MKAYTDLEQSKKLAEILPIESADMALCGKIQPLMTDYISAKKKFSNAGEIPIDPCWSLSALLDVLPDEITKDGDVFRNMFFHLKGKYIIQYPRLTTLWPSLLSVEADNPIDTCVEMIIKLNEQNLL